MGSSDYLGRTAKRRGGNQRPVSAFALRTHVLSERKATLRLIASTEVPARIGELASKQFTAAREIVRRLKRPFGKHHPSESSRLPQDEAPGRFLEARVGRPGQTALRVDAAENDRVFRDRHFL